MELRHIRYFVVVAEEENISRAAQRLHVSQPPLSRQIRDLEDELGVELFERSAKSIRLTQAGRKFLQEARAVLERVERAIQVARESANGERVELHVGYAPTPTAEFLPRLLREFRKISPTVRVILHDMTSKEMLAGLDDGSLQVALIVGHHNNRKNLKHASLKAYPIGVALTNDHPLAGKSKVNLESVIKEPIVAFSRKDYPDYHDWLERLFGARARKLQIVEECDGATSLIAAIEGGRGIAISSKAIEGVAGNRISFVPLTPAPPPLQVVVCYPRNACPGTIAFVETARRIANTKEKTNSKEVS